MCAALSNPERLIFVRIGGSFCWAPFGSKHRMVVTRIFSWTQNSRIDAILCLRHQTIFGQSLNVASTRYCSTLETVSSNCCHRPRMSWDTRRHRLAQVSVTKLHKLLSSVIPIDLHKTNLQITFSFFLFILLNHFYFANKRVF